MAKNKSKQKKRREKYRKQKAANARYFKDYYKNQEGPSIWVLVMVALMVVGMAVFGLSSY